MNATDNFLWTPLHHACYNGHLDIVEVLVKAGAAVNAPAIGDATPLMRAIEACRLDMVYFLITAGADVQAINSCGKISKMGCFFIKNAWDTLRTVLHLGLLLGLG